MPEPPAFPDKVALSVFGIPVRVDATLCAPDEVWIEGPTGEALLIIPATLSSVPQSPDFDQLALNIVGWLLDRHAIPVDVQSKAQEQLAVAAQLRHVWNARGAADFAAVDDIAHTNYEAIANAIRSLDVA